MILFFPAIDGSGSTFTLHLLRDLYEPQFYYHLDTEDILLRMMNKPVRHLVHTGFHLEEAASENGLYVPVAKAEEWLGRADRIVCSVRDPLKVLATAATWGSSWKANPVDKFLAYANWARRFDIFFVPVDVGLGFATPGLTPRAKRGHIIGSLAHYLAMPLKAAVAQRWAREWPVFNDSAQFRPRKEPNPEAVEYLMEHRDALRPFLEDIGYRKLSWWR